MPGTDGGPCKPHDTSWPWDSPYARAMPPPRPRRERRRPAGFIAALLARLWPPAGNHHAIPGTPADDPAPPACRSWDGRCSPGAVTLTDMTAMRVPPYMDVEHAGRHHG